MKIMWCEIIDKRTNFHQRPTDKNVEFLFFQRTHNLNDFANVSDAQHSGFVHKKKTTAEQLAIEF